LHDGHIALIRTVLDEGKPVLVALRNTPVDEGNPHTVAERTQMFWEEFGKEMHDGRLARS